MSQARLTPRIGTVSKIISWLGYEIWPSSPQPHTRTATRIISRLGYEPMSYEPISPYTTRLQSKQNYLTTGL